MKIRIGYNTLRAFGGIVYTWPDQARPASWFIGAIRKALSDDPSTPVRMEILSDEQKALSDAFQKMDGCRMVTQTHLDSLLRGEGVLRLAVFGPECEQDHHDLAQWTRSEVVKYLNENAALVQHYEPDATKHRAQVAQCKTNAPKGGTATAHYSDLVFELAVSQYRQKHPQASAWDACHNLTRQGQPLEKLKHGSAYKRLERRAARRGLSVDEYFKNLDR